MKKLISLFIVLTMLVAMLPMSTASAAEPGTYILPAATTTVEDEAFSGDNNLQILVIPKSVNRIGARAFENCSNLREVYLGKNDSLEIAADAFTGCTNVHFYAYPGTPGALFALARGFVCDLMDEGSSFLERAMTLVANNGGATILQSGEFASKRLIVLRENNQLPDISAYHPTEIDRDNELFILQFNTVDNTADCYTLLANDSQTVFVEADECVEALDSVSAAGVVDPGVWDTADPMGFDAYAPFIAENGNGSAVIAVIDSGVAKNASYSVKLRSDGINMLKAQDGQEWYNDLNRHGSVIASVIGDCVGNANVSILPIRVVGASGTTDFILLGNAIKYAVSHGASIINLSMNFKQSDYVTFCIQQAIAAGVTVVVAAGNAGRNISNVYPANVNGVVTVSGLGKNYQLSASSNYGAGIGYCAPDSYVKTSAYSNSLFNGTSFAAPMIASGLALLSLDPYHTIDDFNNSCYLSNDTDSPTNSYGNGMPQLEILADIPVISIAFSGNLPSKLAVGESVELSWVFNPTNATNKQVTVTSSNENVLTVAVDSSGTVTMTGKGTGKATLTATSASTGVSVSREFTVVRPVSGITISGGKERLSLTRTLQLSAIVSPSNATTKTIEWKSTDETIATVSQSGLVTPKKTGKVGIYAKATDGYGVESEKLWINIVPIPDAESIELYVNGNVVNDTEIPMIPGSTLQIVANVKPEDADQEVRFRALGNYVTVSATGLVTAVSPGIAYVDVTSEDGNASASVRIRVVVLPTSVTISGNTIVNEGETINLTATVLPENAEDRTVSWRSGNEAVATVDSNGRVTGVKAGTAIIYATANGEPTVDTTVTVTVRHPINVTLDLNTSDMSSAVASSASGGGSTIAFSGYEVGTLPEATANYYEFTGWYTAKEGGTRITSTSTLTTTESTYTLYAHWSLAEYVVSWNNGTGYSITVNRTSSPKASASIGNLSSGAKIYQGDVLSISYNASTGYSVLSHGTTGITVSGNVTSSTIYASATANDITYNIVYKSSNGASLGTATATYKYGTTNTISPPAKLGYVTPAAQSVAWDSTSAKTITFTYTPQGTASSQFLTSGTWWKASGNSGITYSVDGEWRNRTANSVQVRVVWTQSIKSAAYGYNQKFYCSFWNGGNNVGNTGSVTIATTSTWPYYSSSGPWHTGSVTAYSDWVTVSLNTTEPTSVVVACDWWTDHSSQPSIRGSWNDKPISIPAY